MHHRYEGRRQRESKDVVCDGDRQEASMYTNMSVNSSSFADLPPPPNFFSNSSDFSICTNTKSFIYIFSAFSLNIIFLTPLLIFVLYLGFQKSRKPRSSSTATSHSDHFTYHSIFMQLVEYNGTAFFFIGRNINSLKMVDVGVALLSVVSSGQALFHLLTCVERYLAVVHPVTYLGLRQGGGVRIRNISIGCVWFLGLVCLAASFLSGQELSRILYSCITCLSLSGVTFCSVSVLCVLNRPRPGEGGGNKEHTDQSKQRAFYTIMGIMGVLLLRLGVNVITNIMYNDFCVALISNLWSGLPSSLVLPLLFLHRVGKLQCCKQTLNQDE
ncbi:hypothetical protein JOQ06_013548 [Pogonophryne albipinna]|uniref:G-protein coupled receptors family 1 profile domain-containing protein n=1 Tax=Pogonophryne albipinna TaxID=1090488 RepID=A0AAD6BK66_9TELE|nr:hypothetical protein JOQ06_013548 [Pogonophryne albipinna]